MHRSNIGAVTTISNELTPSEGTPSFLGITTRGLDNSSAPSETDEKLHTYKDQVPLLSSIYHSPLVTSMMHWHDNGLVKVGPCTV